MPHFKPNFSKRFLTQFDWRGVGSSVRQLPLEDTAHGLTEDGLLKSGRLAGLSMKHAIWVLSWPILIESFLNSFVGLTDTVLSAQLGVAQTDAVGSASYIVWFIGLIIMAIGVGTTALVSRSVGRGRLALANAAVGQSLLLAGSIGSIVAVFIALAGPPMGKVLTQSETGAIAFASYLQIVAAGAPFMAILAAGIASLRGAGDSIRPLWAMVIINVCNIVLSWTLCGEDLSRLTHVDGRLTKEIILHNPFTFDMGVSGIALGTVIANAIGATIVVLMLTKGVGGVRLLRRRLSPHWHTMLRLVRVGLPNFFETLGMWVGNFIILLFVTQLSTHDGMTGAHMLAIRIESFSFLPGFAMGMAAATLAGQYLGAGSPSRAKRAVLTCAFIGATVMGLLGIAFLTIPDKLVALLSSQPEHLELVPHLLYMAGFVQVPFAIAIITRGALRGAGDTKMVLVMTWCTTYLLRLPLAYIFSGVNLPLPGGGVFENPFVNHPSLSGLWFGLLTELVFRCCIFLVRFFQGGWTRNRV